MMTALGNWDGVAHDAAVLAFERAKKSSIAAATLADDLSTAMTNGFWALSSAKQLLMSKAEEIESGSFNVLDSWVVTIKPQELDADGARDLVAERVQKQIEINQFVITMGQADYSTAAGITAAARSAGADVNSGQLVPTLAGLLSGRGGMPEDDVPNPADPMGLRKQLAIAAADAASTVARESTGTNAKGEPTKTLYMQDGSKKVYTETKRLNYGRNYPVLREEIFDPAGTLVTRTETTAWGKDPNGDKITTTYLAGTGNKVVTWTKPDGTVIKTELYDPSGRPLAKADVPDGSFFTHPAATLAGGALTAGDSYFNGAADKTPAALTKSYFQNAGAGARLGGVGLATGMAIYDVITADSPRDKCIAAWSGAAGTVGGVATGALIAPPGAVTGPVDAALVTGGAAFGSWVFGWMGKEIGEAVCD
ncbi:hypothetical protein ACLQ3C_06650 [Gordonia sp. DT30]|uniref:hypothetical protein n=1 Tax=unclassified Gordonia (in: high G+C Gram-positive bacteria) TaxID=2657482 RepID=UPI003CE72297